MSDGETKIQRENRKMEGGREVWDGASKIREMNEGTKDKEQRKKRVRDGNAMETKQQACA